MCMRQEDSPLISVLMGVYYRRENTGLLRRSIDSILQQDYTKLEVLICDDGSTAEAIRTVDSFAGEDRRVQAIRPGNKYALAEKLNACLRQARGELIARMDDDDYAHPDRFEKQVVSLKNSPKIDFLGSNVSIWDGNKITEKWVLPEYPEIRDFLFRQPFVHPSMMFRKEALLAVGGYSEAAHCILCEDYDLLLRLYAAGCRGMNQQEALLDYTVLETAHSGRRMRYRWNETVTRYKRFRELGLLPAKLPYVVKPLAVGMIPRPVLIKLKKIFCRLRDGRHEKCH